jgi:hypothetical protein
MRKVRKNSTEFTSQKPADPPELKPIEPPPPEEPSESYVPPRWHRGYVAALLVWGVAFSFMVGLLVYEGIVGLLAIVRNALGL